MPEHEQARGSTSLERLINHVLQVCVAGALVWFGVAVTELKTSVAVLETKLVEMNKRLDDFKGFMGDRITSTEATAAHSAYDLLLKDHESRIRDLERQQSR